LLNYTTEHCVQEDSIPALYFVGPGINLCLENGCSDQDHCC